jgi:hypothetical protein
LTQYNLGLYPKVGDRLFTSNVGSYLPNEVAITFLKTKPIFSFHNPKCSSILLYNRIIDFVYC